MKVLIDFQVPLSETLQNQIQDICNWTTAPNPKWVQGRSLIIPLDKPLTLNGKVLTAIKIKGSVFQDPVSQNLKPPQPQPYQVSHRSVIRRQVNANGLVELQKKSLSPQGGMFLKDAKQEVFNATRLEAFGWSAALPLGVGVIEGAEGVFDEKQMGMAILGLSDTSDQRISDQVQPLYEHAKELILRNGGDFREEGHLDEDLKTPMQRYWQRMEQVAVILGRDLRALHDKRFVHGFMNLSNAVLRDEQTLFCDLNHLRNFSELHDFNHQVLEVFFDYLHTLMSLLDQMYFFTDSIKESMVKGLYQEIREPLNKDYLWLCDQLNHFPHTAFAKGYFSDLDLEPRSEISRELTDLFDMNRILEACSVVRIVDMQESQVVNLIKKSISSG